MQDIEKLEDFERTRGKLRLPADIKPCIADLIKNPVSINELKPFVIGCELQRIGTPEKKIEALLTRINVKPSKIRAIIQSLVSDKYSYGCPKLEEMGLCLYKSREQCSWYKKIPRQSQKSYRERDFFRFGWPEKLTASEGMVYLAIKEIEKKRRIYAGSSLFISYRELSKTSGVSIGWISECYQRLKKEGLIKFKRGIKHLWYGKASEIQRVIPIPKSK